MIWKKVNEQTRMMIYSAFVMSLVAGSLLFIANINKAEANGGKGVATTSNAAPAALFAADPLTLGAIPDSAVAGPQAPGAPRNVTFTVSGISSAPTLVEVGMTFGSPTHTWRGDIVATLIAPNGTSFVLFGYTGATTATAFGSSNDLAGPYNFKDSAAGTNWWTQASTPTAAGDYRTTVTGPTTNPAAVTNLTAAFAGIPSSNGTWTLRLTDGGSGDTGAISAASLTLTGATVVADAPVDFNGDGKTDYAVVRNTGGGPTGQITWFYNENGTGAPTRAFAWGLATDTFISEDFDGDDKDDIAVWRPGAATVAAFYILNSNGFTARVEPFGQTGDDPTVVDDYNGDNKADLAVYRGGASAGLQSTWFYRTVANGPTTFVPWGVNGDYPAPGDYDGNLSADFVVQRAGTDGQANFWTRLSTGATSVKAFGTPTDTIVPGDYDGDGKTDIATIKGVGGSIEWHWLSSLNGLPQYRTFGASATDYAVQGDYDGDGKTDVAVWRPSATASASAFYTLNSSTGAASIVAFGSNGDYPVANFNSH